MLNPMCFLVLNSFGSAQSPDTPKDMRPATANPSAGSAVQPAKEALEAAVRMRQIAKTNVYQDHPLDSTNRSTKLLPSARGGPSEGSAAAVPAASSTAVSKLKTPGFISARTEASFAAAASLASDRPVSFSAASATVTRRRLVEPVDSRNPRVGRGMAKIYNGDLHAIR
jgi:hypothetical protein